jgi:hypothetical protein
MISYHGYSDSENPHDGPDDWQYSFFQQADDFLQQIDFIENIRRRVAPSTRIAIDEAGTILGFLCLDPHPPRIPSSYWNASGAVYAYLFMYVSKRDIDTLNISNGVGYPGYFPDLSLFDWTTGSPNARFRVLKLIKDNFGPGDVLVRTDIADLKGRRVDDVVTFSDFGAQAYRKADGTKKLLLVNKRNRPVKIRLAAPGNGVELQTVDDLTGGGLPRTSDLRDAILQLRPFSVSVATFR